MKFISNGTWFDKYTEVKIIDEYNTVYREDGEPTLWVLASGLKNGEYDEEVCCADEFIIVGDEYEKI